MDLSDSMEREAQVAHAGIVVGLEELLNYNYIKENSIEAVKKILENHRKKITIPDILFSIRESR